MNEKWQIGHMEVDSLWGNAGGVLKKPEDVEHMNKTQVGFMELGSITLEKRFGSDHDPISKEPLGLRNWYYNPETGEMTNSLSMPNPGMDQTEQDIPEMVKLAHLSKKKLIVNVAPVTDNPIVEIEELVRRAQVAGADKVLVNAGCPHVFDEDGKPHEILCFNANTLYTCLAGLRATTDKYGPVGVRISPMYNLGQLSQTLDAIVRAGTVDSAWTPNTDPNFRPVDENGQPFLEVNNGYGGRSGPAFAEASATQTHWAVRALKPHGIDVVRSSGIMDCEAIGVDAAQELKRSLDIGAVAAAGTTFYYASERGWQEDTDRLFRRFSNLA